MYLLKQSIKSEQDPDTAAFVVRSSSGDIDVLVNLLSNDLPEWSKIILDNGRGKDRREILLNECIFPELQKNVLFGMHTFLGCDQISNFLRKGKKNVPKSSRANSSSFWVFSRPRNRKRRECEADI